MTASIETGHTMYLINVHENEWLNNVGNGVRKDFIWPFEVEVSKKPSYMLVCIDIISKQTFYS